MDVTSLSMVLDPSTNRKIINSSYRIIKKIGQGQYGKVLLGEVIRDPKNDTANSKVPIRSDTVAIKTINRIDKSKLITKSYLSQTTKIKREIQIMKECNHPNVVKLYQVIDDLKFDKILLILEYCKFGEIDWKHYNHYYEKYQTHYDRKPLTINKILRDVVNGLEYLHDFKKIIHRDLKPSNLLIAEDNTIKISDFGVSLILQNNADDQKELSKIMGTPIFYAPELCQFVNNRLSLISKEDSNQVKKVSIDKRIDIWSLGVTLYCLIFNDLPFNGFNEFELFKNIVREELKFPKIKQTSRVTDSDVKELKLLKDLIRKLLTKNPDDRISLEEIKNHQFTTYDLNPGERRSFLNLNNNLFTAKLVTQELKKEAISTDASNIDLSTKIKKLFGAGPKKPAKDPETSSILSTVSENTAAPISSVDIKNLEPLDDLLDSYLDDSSSFTSDIDEEDVVVDTTNITSSPKTAVYGRSPTKSTSSLRAPSSPKSINSIKTPVTPTNNNSITIGASSPSTSSFKSFFSPSRRFFSRNKSKGKNGDTKGQERQEPQPTISSLSSPEKKQKNPMEEKRNPTSNHQHSRTTSRKNSMGSLSSGYKLSKITSSSSSLNLHAYLTDDNLSLASGSEDGAADDTIETVEDEDSDDEGEGVNDTLILNDDSEIFRNYKSMNQYLDGLD
ncbi:kinase-like protein [Suhomyces tanzawaensis NRRL Y-17324]|uniref:Kinase-like protein n=1 Tax=Suhomyces tanzawaensis NRRL Y-17324 TaxID=984487 RepID=A0A1E4SBD5_9ASCO|nr:kinase-like protein [Suhomyces tanzawaensis NRRL Y-17324]ODV76776.1 kinase-like protein [Suhomyces tanzawaensis NRRL Y-17324]